MKLKKIRMTLATGLVALWGMALLRAQSSGGFRFRGVLARVVVPNNATLNKNAIFCMDNPSDSGIQIRVFTILGSEVANFDAGFGLPLPPGSGCPADSILPGHARYATWDGTSNGSVVHSGVYVYQVKAEGLTFTGTLLVVR
ncbi:MAG: hypothetical protein HY077_10845 [Elusimicrobia bacterium]|nr:hypothetical protein [Elusimicrobiota bacterium]